MFDLDHRVNFAAQRLFKMPRFVHAVERKRLQIRFDALAVIGNERVGNAEHFGDFELRSAVGDQVAMPQNADHSVVLLGFSAHGFFQIFEEVFDESRGCEFRLAAQNVFFPPKLFPLGKLKCSDVIRKAHRKIRRASFSAASPAACDDAKL